MGKRKHGHDAHPHEHHRFGPEDQEFQQSQTGPVSQPPPHQHGIDPTKRSPSECGPGNFNFRADPRREGLLTDRGHNK
jgi:hypothetical protein